MQKYENYFKNHSYGTQIQENSLQQNKQMDKKFWKHIKSDDKILEIWTWLWGFANFCLYKGIKDYLWIEIDRWISEKLCEHFNIYKIIDTDALDFFKKTEEKYDIIFMSHVFEHFCIEDGRILAKSILEHLTAKGVWINVMPNAWCISACYGRYADITQVNYSSKCTTK